MENSEFREKLIKRARSFSLGVMRYADTLPSGNVSFGVMARQVIRSSTSVGANIVEAQGASTEKDFSHFLTHALKSANETAYWLDLFADYAGNDDDRLRILRQEVGELGKILGSAVSTIKKKQ